MIDMKIAVNTGNYEILNSIIRTAKEDGHTIAIAKLEKSLFSHIDNEDVDAFVVSSGTDYAQKAVDFIKKYYSYIPVLVIGMNNEYEVNGADSYVPFHKEINTDFYSKVILQNIYMYVKNFETLKRLTAKMGEIIEFGDCKYDPNRRVLTVRGQEVQKLSPKQAGIFEILAANFGNVVKKDIILERVWRDSNYFVGRSLDVFVTHLRKILRENETTMSITNVSNVGLMLNYEPKKK